MGSTHFVCVCLCVFAMELNFDLEFLGEAKRIMALCVCEI